MTKKFRPFKMFRYLVVLMIQFTAAQVVLEICADADLGSECILTCKTSDNAQLISFAKTSDLSNTLGFCLINGGGCSVADTTKYFMNQTGGVTKFIILSHSKLDTGTWRCSYGSTFNDHSLNWAKLPSAISTSTGISENTVVNQTSSIPVTVGVGCLYSENAPSVELQYLPGTDSSFMTCAKSATVCSDPDLSAYDCNKTITSDSATCSDTLYTMQLKVSVSNTRNTFQQQLFTHFTIKFDCINKSANSKDLYILLLWLTDVIPIIAIIYWKSKQNQKIDTNSHMGENIKEKIREKWICYGYVVCVVIKCIQSSIVLPILIKKDSYPDVTVIGIAIPVIAGCPVFNMFIILIGIWCVRFLKNALKKDDMETTDDSPRPSTSLYVGPRVTTKTSTKEKDKIEIAVVKYDMSIYI